jgi:hypothetical protein
LRADAHDFGVGIGLLGQDPRLALVDVLVGAIRERHDLAHGARVLALLEISGEIVGRRRELGVKLGCRQRVGEPPVAVLMNEACAAVVSV